MAVELQRFDDWQKRLTAYLRSVSKKPFEWGEHDCFIFSMNCVKAMTGFDEPLICVGKYDSEESGKQLIKTHGFKSHIHYIAKTFKTRPGGKFSAMRGDLVLMRGVQGVGALGICQGERIYSVGNDGIESAPLENVRKVFKV